MRAHFLLLLLLALLLVPVGGLCIEPTVVLAREASGEESAPAKAVSAPDQPLACDQARSELAGEILELIDGAAREGALDEAAAFELKARIAGGDAADLPTAELFSRGPATNHAKLLQARDRYSILRAMRGIYDDCEKLSDAALKEQLYKLVTAKHHCLGYTGARNYMFSKLDNESGKVVCVYTGRAVATNGIPNAGGSESMNTEHTWPKSLGAGSDPAKSDLHHLYPTDTYANSVRSSYPFGEVKNPEWSQGGSAFDGDRFMPRADHRGNVARSMFYFSIRYRKPLDAGQEVVLRKWHKADPVDADERERNDGIFSAQANRNPFIDRPDLVDQISDF